MHDTYYKFVVRSQSDGHKAKRPTQCVDTKTYVS